MKKVFILIVLVLTLVSCGNNNIEANIANTINNVEANLTGIEEKVEEEVVAVEAVEEVAIDVVIEVEDVEGKIFSKLTGLEITEEQSKVRPIAVMLDNQYKARPQAGLSDAEVVYEILAEGSITRYMAIYQVNQPDVIGPVEVQDPIILKEP